MAKEKKENKGIKGYHCEVTFRWLFPQPPPNIYTYYT